VVRRNRGEGERTERGASVVGGVEQRGDSQQGGGAEVAEIGGWCARDRSEAKNIGEERQRGGEMTDIFES